MDVAKKNIEKLRGKIDIESSLDKGTTFTLRLPLTMAILDGMRVRVDSTQYIIPLANIRKAFHPQDLAYVHPFNQIKSVKIGEKIVPIIELRHFFNLGKKSVSNTNEMLILVQHNEESFCILVDDILGNQQIVIKPLSSYFGEVKGVVGGTILGSGEVSLILDIPSIFEHVSLTQRKEEAHATT